MTKSCGNRRTIAIFLVGLAVAVAGCRGIPITGRVAVDADARAKIDGDVRVAADATATVKGSVEVKLQSALTQARWSPEWSGQPQRHWESPRDESG